MSSEAKRVKLLTLVALFLGVAVICFGIYVAVAGGAAAAYAIVGEGVLTLGFGVRGALTANVPARIGTLAKLAAVVFVLQLVLAGVFVVLVGTDNIDLHVPEVACCACCALISLVIALLSRGMAKRAER